VHLLPHGQQAAAIRARLLLLALPSKRLEGARLGDGLVVQVRELGANLDEACGLGEAQPLLLVHMQAQMKGTGGRVGGGTVSEQQRAVVWRWQEVDAKNCYMSVLCFIVEKFGRNFVKIM
jgi:hypothetical protein